jgi:hypothetical protein
MDESFKPLRTATEAGTRSSPANAAQQFVFPGEILDIRAYGSGNVNDTFLVTVEVRKCSSPPKSPDLPGSRRFILQRLNLQVFRRPDLVMENLVIFTEHGRKRLSRKPLGSGRRWEIPQVLRTRDGRHHFIDAQGAFWRALSFIEDAQSIDILENAGQAQEVGYALGVFHELLSDLPAHRLADTLPGFHLTPLYLRHYNAVLARRRIPSSPEAAYCQKFVEKSRAFAGILEEAKAKGHLKLRPIHGDPKVNNVLLDPVTGQAVGMVDLDTVKPGLVHYDLGDCLRSGANPLGEETEEWQQVRFEPDLARALLQGYLAQAGGFLTPDDYSYIYDALHLLPFELGLRFFTDYLEGNVYFKSRHREHNLWRALVQFRLVESIEAQENTLRNLIGELRPKVFR